ncbi:MAG: hypothetical protein JW804_08035 [Sedimentisphaerales bacterium]|nr:hypothetical protein [Sedimentisphaerales bacterium]
MDIKNYVACDNILGIRTSLKKFDWSFGQPPRTATEDEINQCKIVIKLTIDSLKDEAKRFENSQKYHYWRGDCGRDELYYQRNLFAGSKLRLLLRGIKNGRPEIIINKNYLRFVIGRFINLHSIGYQLTDLACAMLLSRELCPLHCSSFSIDGSTVAVIAPGNTGKTLSTMRAVLHLGASFISEDLAVIDGESIYACPWTSTFRYYDELSMSWFLRMRMKLIKIIPPLELIPIRGGDRKINAYIEDERILSKEKLTHTIILARCPGGVKVLDKKEALFMVRNLNRYEFMYMKSPMMTAYSYFNPELDIFALEEKEKSILSKLVENTTCLLAQSEDPTKFADMIIGSLKK